MCFPAAPPRRRSLRGRSQRSPRATAWRGSRPPVDTDTVSLSLCVFSGFSLCLSRACLGKMIVYTLLKKMCVGEGGGGAICFTVGTRPLSVGSTISLRKTPLFSQLFLCLSRASLGKMTVFIYEWRKKWRFSHRGPPFSHSGFVPPRARSVS